MRSLAIWPPSVGWPPPRSATTVASLSRFLATESDWPDGIAGVGAEQVSAFVLAEAARCSAGSLNNVTTGLRALLRWLQVVGCTPVSLAGAVPAAPGWRDSGLPRAVQPIRSAGCWQAVTGGPAWVAAIVRS